MTEIQVNPREVGRRSRSSYRIGGREYPLHTSRRCKVCNSPNRFDIEEALVGGRTYRKIIESLPEDNNITIENISTHYTGGHMPLEVAASRQIIEARARRVGKRIEDSAEELVDGITLLETTVKKVFEDIASGRLQPEVTDGIRAARILATLGEFDQGNMDQQAMVEAFMVYHETAAEMMSPEQFEEFGLAISNSPVLKALSQRYEGGETVEGTVEKSDEALAGSLDND